MNFFRKSSAVAAKKDSEYIWFMPDRSRTRTPDANKLAKSIVDQVTGSAPPNPPQSDDSGKDPAAVALGRRGGLKGGKARADALSPEQRSEIAKKAAESRWRHKPKT